MGWWDETETRALRAPSPQALGQLYLQRMEAAGIAPGKAMLPCYDLALLTSLCLDYIKLVDGLLTVADGDRDGLRRWGALIARWGESALHWAERSGPVLNELLAALEFSPTELAERESVEPLEAGAPDEQMKADGRFRPFHFLYERLDLKLSSIEAPERVARGLARILARLYDEAVWTLAELYRLEKEGRPRHRAVGRLLLDLNTTWHFDLAVFVLPHGRLREGAPSAPGLPTWLFLAFGSGL
ncbi:MAG TPA: hypothetical protein VK191_16565 [Symbiobacteriaceae bacterium]|nr:hypothetical protein [Symbiobacteriaceae bacterium]